MAVHVDEPGRYQQPVGVDRLTPDDPGGVGVSDEADPIPSDADIPLRPGNAGAIEHVVALDQNAYVARWLGRGNSADRK